MLKYAYLDKHGHWNGPTDMRSRFRGVTGFDQLTDAQRAQKRWYPCTVVNAEFDRRVERRSGPVWTFDEAGQRVTATYAITPIHLSILIREKCREVDSRRDQELAKGVAYTFPDGATSTIQTRDSRDERNVMVNGTSALALVTSGQPEALMQFRTQDDVLHRLTARQMLDMTSYAGEQGQAVYTTSWQVKDEIKALTDRTEIVNHPAWIVDEHDQEVE